MKFRKIIKSLKPLFLFILFALFARIAIHLTGLEDFVIALFLMLSYLYAELFTLTSKTENLQEQKNENQSSLANTLSNFDFTYPFDVTHPDAYLLWQMGTVLNYDLSENYEYWLGGESKLKEALL